MALTTKIVSVSLWPVVAKCAHMPGIHVLLDSVAFLEHRLCTGKDMLKVLPVSLLAEKVPS